MTLPEFVGFLITILVLMFITMRRIRDERFRRENPEEYAEQRQKDEEAFKAFIKSLQGEDEQIGPRRPPEPRASSPLKPPPPPAVEVRREKRRRGDKFALHSKLEGYETHSQIEDRHVETHIKPLEKPQVVSEDLIWGPGVMGATAQAERPSAARELIGSLSDSKKMVLLHEIFGPPKALRHDG